MSQPTMPDPNCPIYQPEDFVSRQDPISGLEKEVGYVGPVYAITYPVMPDCLKGRRLDPLQEMMDWQSWGYRTAPTWRSHDEPNEFTINVLGNIPEWFLKTLRTNGVQVIQTRDRGDPGEHPL
jgi:hypothetical protein